MDKGYTVLKNQMRAIINNLPAGSKFQLNEIIANPPTRLGRTLYEDVQSGSISNVRYIGKENDIGQYEKL